MCVLLPNNMYNTDHVHKSLNVKQNMIFETRVQPNLQRMDSCAAF